MASTILTKALALSEVRRNIMEPKAVTISDTEINLWLETGARIASIITLSTVTYENVTLVENTFEYALTTKFIKVLGVTYGNGDTPAEEQVSLHCIKPRMVGHTIDATASTPTQYFTFADNIYVFPIPAAANGGNKLTVHGAVVAPGTADDAAFGANGDGITGYGENDSLNYFVVNYACACAWTKKGKHSRNAMEMQKFFNGLMMYRNNITNEFDRPDTVDMRRIPDYTQLVQPQRG